MIDVAAVRKELGTDIAQARGRALRNGLHQLALETYEPRHTDDEYFQYMEKNQCSFEVNRPQSKNHVYYFTMFSEKSQHVCGDTIKECLDEAIEGKEYRYR